MDWTHGQNEILRKYMRQINSDVAENEEDHGYDGGIV